MGLNYNYADLTISITLRGDGLDERYVVRPVTSSSFVAWSPPGALNTQSPIVKQTQQLNSGDNTLISAAGLLTVQNLYGFQFTYFAYVPPSNSTNLKLFKGAVGDTGFGIYPNEPMILAIPNPMPANWLVDIYITTAAVCETCLVYIW